MEESGLTLSRTPDDALAKAFDSFPTLEISWARCTGKMTAILRRSDTWLSDQGRKPCIPESGLPVASSAWRASARSRRRGCAPATSRAAPAPAGAAAPAHAPATVVATSWWGLLVIRHRKTAKTPRARPKLTTTIVPTHHLPCMRIPDPPVWAGNRCCPDRFSKRAAACRSIGGSRCRYPSSLHRSSTRCGDAPSPPVHWRNDSHPSTNGTCFDWSRCFLPASVFMHWRGSYSTTTGAC